MTMTSSHADKTGARWLDHASALLAISLLALAGCEPANTTLAPSTQATDASAQPLSADLPKALREVSGLALSDTGKLFAIADEVGRILELDPQTGAVVRHIDIGRPVVTDDFEGLAISNDTITAVTSGGKLYQLDSQPNQTKPSRIVDLHTSERCEIEGLSNADTAGAQWLVCKRTLGDGDDDSVRFLRWNPAQPDRPPEPIDVSNKPILDALGKKNFNPSAVALSDGGRGLLVIAARQRSFALFSLHEDSPAFVLAAPLPDATLHEQAEGLAIARDGRVFIANEGTTGRLFVYPNDAWMHDQAKKK